MLIRLLGGVLLIHMGGVSAADLPVSVVPAAELGAAPRPPDPSRLLERPPLFGASAADLVDFDVPRYGKWDLSAPRTPPGSLGFGKPDFPAAGFRPRAPSALASEALVPKPDENLTFEKSVWQRLSEYKTRDRVRILTLWESTASAVSLQTDRKGGPSLQWTSRWMNRGGATRGVLDRWLPSSLFRFSRAGNPSVPRAPAPQTAGAQAINGPMP